MNNELQNLGVTSCCCHEDNHNTKLEFKSINCKNNRTSEITKNLFS